MHGPRSGTLPDQHSARRSSGADPPDAPGADPSDFLGTFRLGGAPVGITVAVDMADGVAPVMAPPKSKLSAPIGPSSGDQVLNASGSCVMVAAALWRPVTAERTHIVLFNFQPLNPARGGVRVCHPSRRPPAVVRLSRGQKAPQHPRYDRKTVPRRGRLRSASVS